MTLAQSVGEGFQEGTRRWTKAHRQGEGLRDQALKQ
jgi:hypothetical protein